jgi:hypothetical protein
METVTLTLDKLDIEGTKYQETFQAGDTVQAFHPMTLGVIYQGVITGLDDKFARVKFDDQSYNIAYEHITRLIRKGKV